MKHFPFNAFDNDAFESSMRQVYNAAARKLSRTSMTRAVVRQCMEKKVQLGTFIVNLGHKVSICSDVWTDCFCKNSYMGITVHFVDHSWTLNKRLIAFREFPAPHTAQAIAQLIIQVLNEFQLINKIFSVGFDNASANTASIDDLISACSPVIDGKYFHVRCIAHILNLCVQDAIDLWQKYVDPIRTAVKLIHNKAPIGRAWKKYCHSKQCRYTNFRLDVSTRWNSTYDMLESTLNHIEYLCDFFRTCPHVPSDLLLIPSCWDHSMDLFRLFQAFKNATVELSGVYYPTSVRVLEHCMYVAIGFKTCVKNTQFIELKAILFYMVEKWLKYFARIPNVFLIAKCLDPKWKLHGVHKILDMYYGCLHDLDFSQLREMGLTRGESFELNLPNVEEIKLRLDSALRALFGEYEMRYNTIHQVRAPPSPSTFDFGGGNYSNVMIDPDVVSQLQDLYGATTNRTRATSELDIYLESRSIFQNPGPPTQQIDVLDWWGTHDKEFPILSIMAKEIFAVPASTVAVEQAFSVGGCVLDDKRSNLSAKNMEATMLLDDWAKADMRAQEPDFDFRVESDGEEFSTDDEVGSEGAQQYQ